MLVTDQLIAFHRSHNWRCISWCIHNCPPYCHRYYCCHLLQIK